MPLLFSLGQHRHLVAVQAKLKDGEGITAHIDEAGTDDPIDLESRTHCREWENH